MLLTVVKRGQRAGKNDVTRDVSNGNYWHFHIAIYVTKIPKTSSGHYAFSPLTAFSPGGIVNSCVNRAKRFGVNLD